MKKPKKNSIYKGLMTLVCFVFLACSTNVKKADIANTANPQEEIAKLNSDISTAVSENIDVLAPQDFASSVKWYNEAKSDFEDSEKKEEILEDLRIGRGFLQKAYKVAENRAELAAGLFESRQLAMQAGATKYPDLLGELQSVDREVSSRADSLAKVSSQKLASLQSRYVELERRAKVLAEIGATQTRLNNARKDDAMKLAPRSYKKAILSSKNAETVISANVRNPDGYKDAVTTAIADTTLLTDVLSTIKQNGKDLSEAAALKMVSQNRQIKDLNADLKDSKIESDTQKALEAARSQFSAEEADAYQQGNTLLIRLKNINFESGRADLPESAITSLAKVSNIAKEMKAVEIKVEGHTDSVGSRALNMKISDKRAGAVATYFKTNGFEDVEAVGYGFQKPIATNKSKEGRAQNRRVDIVITPENSAVSR